MQRIPICPVKHHVRIQVPDGKLAGDLDVPRDAIGMVIFAHGSGSSRLSPRNQYVANLLRQARLATLLVDLLTEDEEREDDLTAAFRFDIPLLARRLVAVIRWVRSSSELRQLPIGLFGASTGAGAALVAAATERDVRAVVSRGGRPDLAGNMLTHVRAATLLVVGEHDPVVLALNRDALHKLICEKQLIVVRRATHLFEEPGALEEVARLAERWFVRYLGNNASSGRRAVPA
jgi:dienelactone hydrolase